MKQDRQRYLDVLRGIAIFLVVFGHIVHIPMMMVYIYGFHMPLFFFLSGFFLKREKMLDLGSFAMSKVKSVVVPFVILYLATFVYWVVVERHVRGAELSVWSQLVGLVYGTYNRDYMHFNSALWFLPCLFTMQMIYAVVVRLRRWWAIAGVMLVLNCIGLAFREYLSVLPWGICAAMIGGVFLCMGNLMRPLIEKIKCGGWVLIGIAVLCIVVQVLLLPVSVFNLSSLKFYYPYMYIPVAVVGISVYYCIAKVIGHNRVIEWMGVNSLVIFGFQEPVFRAVLYVVSKVSGFELEMMRNNIYMCLLCTALTIGAIWPLTKVRKPFVNLICGFLSTFWGEKNGIGHDQNSLCS